MARSARCARCGLEVVTLAGLEERARRSLEALDGRRLVVPAEVREGLVVLAGSLRCWAGRCGEVAP
jgi:hypothetical protein